MQCMFRLLLLVSQERVTRKYVNSTLVLAIIVFVLGLTRKSDSEVGKQYSGVSYYCFCYWSHKKE